MDLHPWVILRSFRPFNDLRVDEVLFPNGKTGQKLIHEYSPWATILALTEDNEVVMVRQYRHGMQKIILEFPGGVVDEGEEPIEAAKRELLEETGYAGENWTFLGAPSPNPDNHTNRIHTFLVKGAKPFGDHQLDENEELEVVLKPLEEVFEMARVGELHQAMQISALFLALPHLK